MHHHILLRKGTLEKLQKIPPKMTIFIDTTLHQEK